MVDITVFQVLLPWPCPETIRLLEIEAEKVMVIKKGPAFSVDLATGCKDATTDVTDGIRVSRFCRIADWSWGDEEVRKDNKADFCREE